MTIAPRVGPVQGVQASAKAAPISTGPPRPARSINPSKCQLRLNAGTNEDSRNTTPITMITAPEIFSAVVPVSSVRSARWPSRPSAMKMNEKLPQNASVGPITRLARISSGRPPATADR